MRALKEGSQALATLLQGSGRFWKGSNHLFSRIGYGTQSGEERELVFRAWGDVSVPEDLEGFCVSVCLDQNTHLEASEL